MDYQTTILIIMVHPLYSRSRAPARRSRKRPTNILVIPQMSPSITGLHVKVLYQYTSSLALRNIHVGPLHTTDQKTCLRRSWTDLAESRCRVRELNNSPADIISGARPKMRFCPFGAPRSGRIMIKNATHPRIVIGRTILRVRFSWGVKCMTYPHEFCYSQPVEKVPWSPVYQSSRC
jgi:hypothetical protein